jgi:hypothetical protein
MATGTDIQVTISPAAQAKIDSFAQRTEFEQTLEYAKRAIPGVTHIEVDAPWIHHYQDDPIVFLDIYCSPAQGQADPRVLENRLACWQRETFPPEVYVNFHPRVQFGAPHGR